MTHATELADRPAHNETVFIRLSEIEITDKMLHAGAKVLTPKIVANLMDCWVGPTEVARKGFAAMIQAAQ